MVKKTIKKIVFHLLGILTRITTYVKLNIGANRNKYFLMNTPTHCNIGDQAITLAELEWLKRNFPKTKIIEITETEWRYQKKFITENIGADELILVHGGGYLGTIWREQAENAFDIMESFANNKKIVFPQTAFYDNQKTLEQDAERYRRLNNLWICARDKETYNILVEKLLVAEESVLLVPDIVTTYRWRKEKKRNKREKFFLVFRNDIEKTLRVEEKNNIINALAKGKQEYVQTDMCNRFFFFPFRKMHVRCKLRKFSKAACIITDRLHGMYFSAISDTPCIALNNVSGKVKGGYYWLENNPSVFMCEDYKDVINVLNSNVFTGKEHEFECYEKKLEVVKKLIDTMYP